MPEHITKPTSTEPADDRNKRFVRLLTQNERRIFAFILALVPNWSDADDVLQETNVRLWEQFDRFEPGTDFGAWACTIARYQVMTLRKTKLRSRLVFSDEFVKTVAEEYETQSGLTAARREALERCIELLNPRHREMLRAYYEPQTTAEDVAKRIGRTVQAVYKTLQRVRKALHDCIDDRVAAGDQA